MANITIGTQSITENKQNTGILYKTTFIAYHFKNVITIKNTRYNFTQ